MAIKHGCTLPTGIVATGVLVHEVRVRTEDKAIESPDENGAFAAGKSLSGKRTTSVSGEMLEAASLPAAQSGEGTDGDPRIKSVEVTDAAEAASKFSIEAEENLAGTGAYGPS